MGFMPMTREEALKYHRQMWGDMLENIGDEATADEREDFKEKWLRAHFPGENFRHNCILCTYVKKDINSNKKCRNCPINWEKLVSGDEPYVPHGGRCYLEYKGGGVEGAIYLDAPISEILALPERKDT